VLIFLLLRQVMPIASSLAGGLSLSSLGMISRAVSSVGSYGRRQSAAAGKAIVRRQILNWRERRQSTAPAPVSWRDQEQGRP
jgi:hypothetical protein